MRIKYLLLLVTALLSSLFGLLPWASHSQAANEPTGLTNVTLWIYPEYDDPRLLIMLEGQISGATTPTRIRFLVPTDAEMFSAGSKDPQGKYSGGPPDRTASQIPGWDEISYNLQSSTFRVEYYDPIIIGQIEKQISYDFLSVYPISSLSTIVQVPTNATNFSVVPQGTKTVEGNFTVYSSKFNTLAADQSLHFDIKYSKSDPNPSITNGPALPPASGNTNLLPIMIAAGVVIVAGTLIWAIKSTRKDKKTSKAPLKNIQSGGRKPKELPDKFCNQCGQHLEYPSKFCPRCRHKLN